MSLVITSLHNLLMVYNMFKLNLTKTSVRYRVMTLPYKTFRSNMACSSSHSYSTTEVEFIQRILIPRFDP